MTLLLKTKTILTLFIIVFCVLTVPNMLRQNLIGDEAVYITEGDRYLHEPYSFYYNSGSPHLLKSLSAVFYYALPLNRNYAPYFDQNYTNVYTVGQFIYDQNTAYATRIIQRARIPHLLLAIIMGILIFLFTQKYTQTKTALIALALYTFSPIILAHASTANLDLGAAAFTFFTLAAYFATLKKYQSDSSLDSKQSSKAPVIQKEFPLSHADPAPQNTAYALQSSRNTTYEKSDSSTPLKNKINQKLSLSDPARWVLITGILLGSAQLTKISAVLLYPFIYITAAIFLKKNKFKIPFYVTLISIATIIALYGFQAGPIITQRDDPAGIESIYGSIPLVKAYKNQITDFLRLPIFPAGAYLNTFTYQLTHSFYGHTIYLDGMFTDQGLWYFIPVLFIYKNSILFLIAIVITLIVFITRARHKNPFIMYLSIWCVLILVWSVTNKLQLGIRYVLPLFPPLFILVADGLTHIPKSSLRASVLVILYAISTLTVYPNYFTYTTEFLRTQNQLNSMSDSDYDWGQSVYKLGLVQKQKKLEPLYFSQSGGASQSYYGIKNEQNADEAFANKKSGYYAFSQSALVSFKKNNPPIFDYFVNKTPYTIIDNTIYVYKVIPF